MDGQFDATVDAIEGLLALEGLLRRMCTWCDASGERGTGTHSVSHETVMRMLRIVSATADCLIAGRPVAEFLGSDVEVGEWLAGEADGGQGWTSS